jgi:hypothetical protein
MTVTGWGRFWEAVSSENYLSGGSGLGFEASGWFFLS